MTVCKQLVRALILVAGLSEVAAGQSTLTPRTQAVVDAIRSGGLPAAAALVGHYVGPAEMDSRVVATDLFAMATRCDLVILGRVQSKAQAHLAANLRLITTDYQFTVLERYQGTTTVGAVVTARMPGGVVQFANGTTAEIRADQFPGGLEENGEYVLFLQKVQGSSGVFELFLGAQGLFGFSPDQHVTSAARATDEVFRKYNGVEKSAFLSAVRSSTIP